LMRSHFIPPQEIADSFRYPNSTVDIEINASNAWIVIKKLDH
jgi:hypothetical protein